MMKISCDGCGRDIGGNPSTISYIPSIRINLGGEQDRSRGPDRWVRFCPDGLICEFVTTDVHYCRECVVRALKRAVEKL